MIFMKDGQSRPGYTLPVFACASAIAAWQCLQGNEIKETVAIDLIEPSHIANIPIEQVAKISQNAALAITRSDPGDNLDLTRNTPIWAVVELIFDGGEQIVIEGGQGIGKQIDNEGKAAIYRYAQKLLQENLRQYLKPSDRIKVTIILPEGRRLAQRTSNAAFGVVEGLSLLGTTGISQPLSAPSQLENFQAELSEKATKFDCLVFCVGENGLDLARQQGINPEKLIKTANWLGPLLVAAGLQKVRFILLFGYHGKLIKLAGGIFHTHHYLADGRLEIFTAHCAKVGLPTLDLQTIFASSTTEAALNLLRDIDLETGSQWSEKVYYSLAETIDQRTQEYIRKQSETEVQIGSVLFDRDRRIIVTSENGKIMRKLLS